MYNIQYNVSTHVSCTHLMCNIVHTCIYWTCTCIHVPGESECAGASSDSPDSSSFFKPRSLGGSPITERSLMALEDMSSMDSHNREYL